MYRDVKRYRHMAVLARTPVEASGVAVRFRRHCTSNMKSPKTEAANVTLRPVPRAPLDSLV